MSFLASVANTWLPDLPPATGSAVPLSLIATDRKWSLQGGNPDLVAWQECILIPLCEHIKLCPHILVSLEPLFASSSCSGQSQLGSGNERGLIKQVGYGGVFCQGLFCSATDDFW